MKVLNQPLVTTVNCHPRRLVNDWQRQFADKTLTKKFPTKLKTKAKHNKVQEIQLPVYKTLKFYTAKTGLRKGGPRATLLTWVTVQINEHICAIYDYK